MNVIAFYFISFSSLITGIILEERANITNGNPQDFYERMKKVPVKEVEMKNTLNSYLTKNPLLSNLPMFSKERPPDRREVPTTTVSSMAELKVFSKNEKLLASKDFDNFGKEYFNMNESLFDLGLSHDTSNIRFSPTVRSSSNELTMESMSDEEMTTEEPFAVTDTLINSLESAPSPDSTTSKPITTQPPTISTSLPASIYFGQTSSIIPSTTSGSSFFSSPVPTTTEIPSVTTTSVPAAIQSSHKEEQKLGLAKSQFMGQHFMKFQSFPEVAPSRSDENRIRSQQSGHMEVWGTKYYEDNRIEGGIQTNPLVDISQPADDENVFAVETELMRIRDHEKRIQRKNKNLVHGSKILSSENEDLNFGKIINSNPEIEIETATELLEKDGKTVERRTSQIHDHQVVVTLANPMLFGHDYLQHPGSIIQPSIASYKDTLEGVKKQRSKTKKVKAFGTPIGPYDHLIDTKVFDSVKKTNIPHEKTKIAATLRGVCSQGTSALFVRSADVEESVGLGKTVVIQSNEDDCVFACLTNKVDDKLPFDCVSASYHKETRDCQLTSDVTRHLLRPSLGTIYYEKTCVDTTVAEACSGATVERKEQNVLVGFVRDAYATESIEECISICISSEISSGYRCLSFMYYYEENLNCILNDASELTVPNSLVKELTTDVDYFEVDQCYGIAYASDDRHIPSTALKIQNARYVEDDVRVGEITSGSMVRPLMSKRLQRLQKKFRKL